MVLRKIHISELLISDEGKIAQELHDKVKVLCWIMTNPSNLWTKAQHVKATWGRRCNKLVFISSETNTQLPAVGVDVEEGRDFLWAKTRKAHQYLYDHHINDFDWFIKADDDTYVVMENLRHMLSRFTPEEPIWFGRRFRPYVPGGYMSGGAGYVLSKEAVTRFVTLALKDDGICRTDPGGAEDVEIGVCLHNVGVNARDSRDEYGRETFHPFVPEHHLIPSLIPKDNWLWEYNYYPYKEV